MPPLRSGLLGLVSLLLAACGARSSLLPSDATGEGGTGGAGGTTSTSSSIGGTAGTGGGVTTGGTTGTVAACPELVVDGPPLQPVPALGGSYQGLPWLASTELDGSRAGFVYVEQFQPFGEFLEVTSVALDDPWGAWPASIGPSAYTGMADRFVIGSAEDGKFSMLTTDEPKNSSNDPAGMVVWAPGAGVPGAEGQFFDDIPPGFPLLVTSNGGWYLAGFQRHLDGDLYHLSLARVTIGGGPPFTFGSPVTCATSAALAGSAIPLGNGFLAALSNGRPFGKCLTDDLADGPPSRLQIVTVQDDPMKGTLTFEQDLKDTYILQTYLTPAKGGAWAAWERVSSGSPFERHIQIVQLDASGAPVNGKILEVGFGTVATPFAIASVGSGVAVATRAESGALEVHLLTADGSSAGKAAFESGPGLETDGSVTLLGAPSGDHLLVGWGETSIVDNDGRLVRLARLGCMDP